ncbi:class I SAM-dependent methyltransferase [Nocardioides sp. HDW12B]|uniref:class I SAM-dependent methyltransferase n=1 Tax=Nocardioides sp. HDW12B TaxID=2714939 RepID=UPI00140CCC19|nr:class I SAM-dependent methyltransferase [Nocardioides sp. HDW12B]QIK66774.1 class I SAM-dependent methyltransferase [Nocardioides sp. HDW12B]
MTTPAPYDHAPHDHAADGTDRAVDPAEEFRALFEPEGWDERYAGSGRTWSGRPNAQLVTEAGRLAPRAAGAAGTALDLGCGEGGDVVWLAQQGWHVTGADFSQAGLERARAHAEEAGAAGQCDWWQVDARDLDADGRTWDLVTTHFLHPADGGMVAVVRRLADAVAPGGHLLVVGHAPVPDMPGPSWRTSAMFRAADLVPGLEGTGLDVVTVDQRPRRQVHDGHDMDVEDSVLLARRPA